MRKEYKKAILMILSVIIACGLMTGCGYHITLGNGVNFLDRDDALEFNVEKSVIDPITTIVIDTEMAEVDLIEADDYYVEIDYLYWEEKPEYTLEDGKLYFNDSRAFPNSYSINFNLRNKIKVYLPKDADMNDVVIQTSSGDVNIEGFVADELEIAVAYGDFTMKNAAAVDADITLSSGTSKITDFQVSEMNFTNSYGNGHFTNINTSDELISDISSDRIKIIMSSGDVKLNKMKASSIDINNSYGNITCDYVTAEEFETDLSSGNLDVDHADLKVIDVSNSYGDVNLDLIGSDTDYALDLSTSYGSIQVGNKKYEENYDSENGGNRKVTADLSSGNVKIGFE